MTADGRPTTLTGACHSLLLRLAGRVPDGLLAQSRTWLAAKEPERMAGAVASHAAGVGLVLTAEDAGILGWILTGAGMDAGVVARVPVEAGVVEGVVAHAFAPAAPEVVARRGAEFGPCWDLSDGSVGGLVGEPGDELVDELDQAAIAAVSRIVGAIALWRAWRAPSDGSPWPPPRRVFLLAVDAESEPFEATAMLQNSLTTHGETDPQVEAFTFDEDLPAYQRSARARSTLLWTSVQPEPIHLAPIYDGVTTDGTPFFDLDRPRLAAAEREPIAAALEGGTLLASTTARLDDVLAPADGRGRVPASFRTDGVWVWSDAVAYYLRAHGVAPAAGLLSHLDHRHTTLAAASPDALAMFRATAALTRPPDSSS
jgi:hypothetical protein